MVGTRQQQKKTPSKDEAQWRRIIDGYESRGGRTGLGVIVIEEPKDSYFRQTKADIGMGVTTSQRVAPRRWKHIKAFHIIESPTEQSPNMYMAQRLDVPHYMVPLDELESFLACVRHDNTRNEVIWHESDGDADSRGFESNFVGYWNFDGTTSIQGEYDFARLKVDRKNLPVKVMDFFQQLAVSVEQEESTDKNRKNKAKDIGFSGDRNLDRKGKPYGIATPRRRKESKEDNLMKAAMVLLSRLTGERLPNGFLSKRKQDTRRDNEFCKEIHEENIFEAFRAALTSVDPNEILGVHEDVHNDSKFPDYAFVPCLSVIVTVGEKLYRLSLIGYSRRSIRSCLERRVRLGPLIDQIEDFFGKSDAIRKEYMVELLEGLDDTPKRILPNFDKGVWYSSFVTAIRRLSKVLSSDQIIGVWAACCMCESPDFFWEYHNIVLENLKRPKRKGKISSVTVVSADDDAKTIAYKFGVFIFKRREQERTTTGASKKKSKGKPNRKRKRKDETVDLDGGKPIGGARHQPHLNKRPTLADCERGVDVLSHMQREVFLEDQYNQLDESRYGQMIRILSHKDGVLGAGLLTSQHLVAIGSLSGLLPERLLQFAEVSMTTKTAQYLHDHWGFTEENHTDDSMQLLACLSERLGITKLTVENLVCEWCRSQRQRPSRYHDSIYPGQDLYRYNAKENRVYRLQQGSVGESVFFAEKMDKARLTVTRKEKKITSGTLVKGNFTSFWERKAVKTRNRLPRKRNRKHPIACANGLFTGKTSTAKDATPDVETARLGLNRKAVGLLTEVGECLKMLSGTDDSRDDFLKKSHIKYEHTKGAYGDVYHTCSLSLNGVDVSKEAWALVSGRRIFPDPNTLVGAFLFGDSLDVESRVMPLANKKWDGRRLNVRYFLDKKDAYDYLMWSVLLLSEHEGGWIRRFLIGRDFLSSSPSCRGYEDDEADYAVSNYRRKMRKRKAAVVTTSRANRVVRGVPLGKLLLVSDAAFRLDRVSCVLYDWGDELTLHKVDDTPGPENRGYTGVPLFIQDCPRAGASR